MDTENKFSTSMEKENWIETILNSANKISTVTPSDNLFSKIQERIQLERTVSSKTVWLVAASIAILVVINFSVLKTKTAQKTNTTTAYLESTLNQSNQLYQ